MTIPGLKATFLNVIIYQRHIIFPFNSPLRHMFAMGTLQARERGVEHNLLMQWVGRNKMDKSIVKNTVLSLGQLILVFVCLAVAFSMSIAILGFEMAYTLVKSRFTTTNK
jgi:hypothetical protein